MAIPPRIGAAAHKQKAPPLPPATALLAAVAAAGALSALCLLSSPSSPAASAIGASSRGSEAERNGKKYLYWADRIDCPGKHCGSCTGLGHQESSLRCALEEALFLGRYSVCGILASRS